MEKADIEAKFEDIKGLLQKEIEGRSNDSALKDEYNRKLGEISAQLNEVQVQVQQQQERKDKEEWKEQKERKTNENLKDGKYEM